MTRRLTCEPNTIRLFVGSSKQNIKADDRDLLDLCTIRTITNRGTAYAVEPNALPGGGLVAAGFALKVLCSGSAAGCEARLCLAVTVAHHFGLCPRFGLRPVFMGQRPYQGHSPTSFFPARRGTASPHIRRQSRTERTFDEAKPCFDFTTAYILVCERCVESSRPVIDVGNAIAKRTSSCAARCR